ncbi:MAG: group 1 truncated hemoglobin [Moraxellaceae bacterium]|nr:MAG: group 1 truncated hemoglobin [Moraxellaceae bacterium]
MLLTLLNACSTQPKTTLYQQLGGQAGINTLTDKFIERIGHDKQILPFFAATKISYFRTQFALHLCAISDGPCQYNGDTLAQIHTGMAIKHSDFNRVVELLVAAMDDAKIAQRAQNQLLARLAPMRKDVMYPQQQ